MTLVSVTLNAKARALYDEIDELARNRIEADVAANGLTMAASNGHCFTQPVTDCCTIHRSGRMLSACSHGCVSLSCILGSCLPTTSSNFGSPWTTVTAPSRPRSHLRNALGYRGFLLTASRTARSAQFASTHLRRIRGSRSVRIATVLLGEQEAFCEMRMR
jgi:hypothetical protein